MKFIKIDSLEYYNQVKSIFYDIFPEEIGRNNCGVYLDSINGTFNGCNRLEYYLAEDNNNLIGLTGIYSVNNEEAWLGWYGVRPKFRKQGYGKKILEFTLDKMKSYGYKIVLLYTEKEVNKDAILLYNKIGFKEGKSYDLNDNNAEIIGDYQDRTKKCINTIYFKSLINKEINEWNGTPIF